jgi:Domain of unknown function (DUF4333)
MSRLVRSGATAAAVATIAVLAGCGETVIDSTKAEGAIQSNLEKSLHHRVSSVSCPSGQEVEPGATFECTVDFADGKRATATLKIRDRDANISLIGLRANG